MDNDKDLQVTIAEEAAITHLVQKKLSALDVYSPENAGLLSQCLAEIMVLSKNLYLNILPEITEADESEKEDVWQLITGLRMHLMHTKDCIENFDTWLLELMEDSDEESEEDDEEENE